MAKKSDTDSEKVESARFDSAEKYCEFLTQQYLKYAKGELESDELDVILEEARLQYSQENSSPSRTELELAKKDRLSRHVNTASEMARRIKAQAYKKSIDLSSDNVWVNETPLTLHTTRLTLLFNNVAHSKAYDDWQTKKRGKLVETLTARKSFHRAAKGWPYLDPEKKAKFLKMVSDAHQGIYGASLFEPKDYTYSFYKKPRPKCKNARYAKGSFSNLGGYYNMRLNIHPDTRFDDFIVAMEVIHHELTHGVQDAIGELFITDKISPHHPLYEDARYYYMFKSEKRSYLHTIESVYRAHPLEKDAFAQGAYFSAELNLALKQKGVKPFRLK
jgi:hypothetical protein